MSLRRLAPPDIQPASFAFTDANLARADHEIAKYPPGRQASAVISLLWIGQEQQGWVTHPMIEAVGKKLDMPFIRVLEVATFYTMFNLAPVGKYHLQVCTTPPCLLRGSDDVVKACEKLIGHAQMKPTADSMLSWTEVECLGACTNAPMFQVGSDFYEDLDGPLAEKLIAAFRKGQPLKPGPQAGRVGSEPAGGKNTLTDPALYAKKPEPA
jgi:NADH-quinone oxidoreductase subunit E